MCTFLSTLPKKSRTAGTNKKKNLVLSLRPCPDTPTEKTWYQLRLLNFSSKTNRDHPFIQRYIHQIWKKNEKGFSEIESEVVCPVTKWTDWDDDDRYSCPICRYVQQQWKALQDSNFKDRDAAQKKNTFSRKFQAIVPVYVKNDPNYEGNNNKFKVIIFNDPKIYKQFYEKLERQLLKCNCFNGVNASDLCLHISLQDKLVNEGQPNQYTFHQKVIDQIAFSKPSDIPSITKDAIDQNFPFDDTYYVSSTKQEIDDFYKKYIKVSGPELMDEAEDLPIYKEPDESPVNKIPVQSMTNVAAPTASVSNIDIDELCTDSPAPVVPASVAPVQAPVKPVSSIDIEDAESLLDGMSDMH